MTAMHADTDTQNQLCTEDEAVLALLSFHTKTCTSTADRGSDSTHDDIGGCYSPKSGTGISACAHDVDIAVTEHEAEEVVVDNEDRDVYNETTFTDRWDETDMDVAMSLRMLGTIHQQFPQREEVQSNVEVKKSASKGKSSKKNVGKIQEEDERKTKIREPKIRTPAKVKSVNKRLQKNKGTDMNDMSLNKDCRDAESNFAKSTVTKGAKAKLVSSANTQQIKVSKKQVKRQKRSREEETVDDTHDTTVGSGIFSNSIGSMKKGGLNGIVVSQKELTDTKNRRKKNRVDNENENRNVKFTLSVPVDNSSASTVSVPSSSNQTDTKDDMIQASGSSINEIDALPQKKKQKRSVKKQVDAVAVDVDTSATVKSSMKRPSTKKVPKKSGSSNTSTKAEVVEKSAAGVDSACVLDSATAMSVAGRRLVGIDNMYSTSDTDTVSDAQGHGQSRKDLPPPPIISPTTPPTVSMSNRAINSRIVHEDDDIGNSVGSIIRNRRMVEQLQFNKNHMSTFNHNKGDGNEVQQQQLYQRLLEDKHQHMQKQAVLRMMLDDNQYKQQQHHQQMLMMVPSPENSERGIGENDIDELELLRRHRMRQQQQIQLMLLQEQEEEILRHQYELEQTIHRRMVLWNSNGSFNVDLVKNEVDNSNIDTSLRQREESNDQLELRRMILLRELQMQPVPALEQNHQQHPFLQPQQFNPHYLQGQEIRQRHHVGSLLNDNELHTRELILNEIQRRDAFNQLSQQQKQPNLPLGVDGSSYPIVPFRANISTGSSYDTIDDTFDDSCHSRKCITESSSTTSSTSTCHDVSGKQPIIHNQMDHHHHHHEASLVQNEIRKRDMLRRLL